MFSKFNLIELLQDGFSEIRVSSKLFCALFWHYVVPILFSLIFIFFNINLDSDIISNIIGSISIFSGLLFSVIFIVTENYAKRKNLLSENYNVEAKSYLERYKDFTKHITTLILFSVAVAIISIVFLIIYLFVTKANLQVIKINDNVIQILKDTNIDYSRVKLLTLLFLQMLSFICLYNYLMIIVTLIKEVYAMIFDDINSGL